MRPIVRFVPALLLVVSIATLLGSRADTVPLYAARTGNPCKTCHFEPNGGGPRNEFGFTFARNRHSIDSEPEGSPWHDLTLTNRVGENMPLYIGVNHRFMLLGNNTRDLKGIDRLGFFNMENSIHLAFQPHPQLTLVYSQDAFANTSDAPTELHDAFGMIGLPRSAYLKAGRFRSPFGLRMDDHTVATRNSFLDFSGGSPVSPARFLPYDPRVPDMGLEVGGEHGPLYARMAFTNGPANVLGGSPASNRFAETKAVKVGYNAPWYQGGFSFYDSFEKGTGRRATRWGYFGMTHFGPVVALGEAAAGTDDQGVPKFNRLAAFGELDYAPARFVNIRGRVDYLELDRGNGIITLPDASEHKVRDVNTHSRFALEAEYVPVPFAELRATVRRILHKDTAAFGHSNETQGYLQFHFSY